MRGKMNLDRYEISIRLKISLQCLISSLLIFIWIEEKWSSRRYGFHISHFDRNGVQNWYEIFMWTKFTQSKLTGWILCLMCMCIWNLSGVWFSYRSFWQKWNFILGDKIWRKHYPKWNAYAYPSKYRVVLKCSRNETSCEQNLISRRFEISYQFEFISLLVWMYL